jgi:ubiquitin carboxyl-terminal hydrolase 4/11/15
MPGERIQMHPPVYTLYVLQPPSDLAGSSAEDNTPIRLTCPSEAPFHILVEFASNLIGGSSGSSRLWMIDAALAKENNDPAILPALKSRDIAPSVLVGLNGRMLGSNEPTDETCSSKQLEGGDTLVLEIKGSDWIVDLTPAGEPQEKLTVNMPPVSKAPPPLFSKPAFFGGSGVSSASSAEGSNTSDRMTRSQSRPRRGKGLVGLVNLGNTCFMNSAVQCLSNTVELNDYFISGVYRDELNPDNPLGMGGQVAEAFGGVIEALWSSSAHSSFSPRNLKWTTSRFAPQFAGYGQHDTQEFIAFLLDGLHEDLNRIKKKPYIEKPDWKPGGGATELAELGKECWEGYKKRNDSVIVDLFQGQLQSTLVCPECHKVSLKLLPPLTCRNPSPWTRSCISPCPFPSLSTASSSCATSLEIRTNLPSKFACSSAKTPPSKLSRTSSLSWSRSTHHT